MNDPFGPEGYQDDTPPVDTVEFTDDLVALCHVMKGLIDKRASLRAELRAIDNDIEAGQPRLKAVMDSLGVSNVRVDGVGTVYLQTNPYPKVLKRDEFVDWLDAQQEGSIAIRNVNPQTLRSWVKDRMESGSELPPDEILSVYLEKEVRIRGAK